MDQTKTIWQSKTFWLAVAQALAGVIMVFATSYPTVGWLAMGKSVVDIILRVISTQPVTIS